MEKQPLLDKADVALPPPVVAAPVRRRCRVLRPLHVLFFTALGLLAASHVLGGPPLSWAITPLGGFGFGFGARPSAPAELPMRQYGAPIDGSLHLTNPLCRAYGGTPVEPPAESFDVLFGSAARNLTIRQTQHGTNTPSRPSPPPTDPEDPAASRPHWRRAHIDGTVVLREATAAYPAGAVVVEWVSNDERLVATVTAPLPDAEDQTFVLQTPDGFWAGAGDDDADEPGTDPLAGYPCLLARITVYVPAAADEAVEAAAFQLGRLDVVAVHLGVTLVDGLDLPVADYAGLHTVSGTIAGPSEAEAGGLLANHTDVHVVSGNIHGRWSLRQSLLLSTVSGDVNVAVEEVSLVDPTGLAGPIDPLDVPTLRISTISGNVDLRELPSTAAVPGHRLAVDTRSGDVAVTDGVVAGSARVHTVSGDIQLGLTVLAPPAGSNATVALETASVSGETAVDVAYEAADADDVLDFLHATHRAVSGAIALHYPAAWEGVFRLSTLVGALTLEGKDVHVIPAPPRFPPVIAHHIEGSKGDALNASSVGAESRSGSILLAFPE